MRIRSLIVGSMHSCGVAVERAVLPGVVTLRLDAAAARRHVVRRLQVRRAQAREEDVLVVDVGPVCVEQIGAIDDQVHDHDLGARQLRGRLEDVRRSALDPRHQLRQRHRRDHARVGHGHAVGEADLLRLRVDRLEGVAEPQIGAVHESPQVGHESAVRRIAEVADVVDVRRRGHRGRRAAPPPAWPGTGAGRSNRGSCSWPRSCGT